MRGVELVKIEVIPFQYNPITNDLISYDEIEIRYRLRLIFSGNLLSEIDKSGLEELLNSN